LPTGEQASLQQGIQCDAGRTYLTGIQALVRVPVDSRRADRRAGAATAGFISGYEGSPLAGYDLELNRRIDVLSAHDIVFTPAVNEELAATAVQGTQLVSASLHAGVVGVTGWWYGKSPGLDRAADSIRHNNLMGTHPQGGAIAIVGDDPAAKSSTVPGASDQLLADLGVPTLYPADLQDVLDLGLHAVALSRCSGLWTAMKITTNVADSSATVDTGADRVAPKIPVMDFRGRPYQHQVNAFLLQPTLDELELTRDTVRIEIARRYCAANNLNRIVHGGADDRIGIVAAGKTFVDVQQALHAMKLDPPELSTRGVRLMKLAMTYPLDPAGIQRFATGLKEIIVIEEKRPLLETAIKEILYSAAHRPRITGKQTAKPAEALPVHGELDPDKIASTLSASLLRLGHFPSVEQWVKSRKGVRTRIELPLLARQPYFCSGCPHNSSAKAPAGTLVGGGIGCHGLVLGMNPNEFGKVIGLTQMGGEGAQWIGMAPFLNDQHFTQNLGDGTFHHSGSLAIRASVAASVNITYKLLHNSAVAMTGGQQPAGQLPLAKIVAALRAEGVRKVIVTSDKPRALRHLRRIGGVRVWHRSRLMEAQQRLARIAGVTVLIHDQECATELRRKRKRGLAPQPTQRIIINERVCEGCGDCGRKSNCLSVRPVATEFGRKTQIDQTTCNHDYSCLEGDCPAFVSVIPKGKPNRGVLSPLLGESLPEPESRLTKEQYTIRIAGTGGTGVVTLSQILGAAAASAGFDVRSLDQTGLAQKGGAVVSDIKFSRQRQAIASKAAQGEVDLLLGCDLLVTADPRYLAASDPERTAAVISTTEVATGAMVSDPSVTFPDHKRLIDCIRESTVPARLLFFDARRLATELFGQDELANILLTGAAYQAGHIPIPAASIEDAIRRRGAQVEQNIQAFRTGRQIVADPQSVPSFLGRSGVAGQVPLSHHLAGESTVGGAAGCRLKQVVKPRVIDLVAYQNAKYAQRYASFVEQVRLVEQTRLPGSTELTETVARYLYKLMAYKDEYEVARLTLEPRLRQDIEKQFGPGAKVAYRLHPPMLRSLGLKSKISLPQWVRPLFAALRAGRRLRGTPLDIFGYTYLRRTERSLIEEYRTTVETLLARLSADNHAQAVVIAALPDVVRGYEALKMRNVATYRDSTRELLATMIAPPVNVAGCPD
jgi:indolepyruvate ferredoxin oxidoreductase